MATVHKIIEQARENGKIIILACHDFRELQALSDEIFVMDKGKITDHVVTGEISEEDGKYIHVEA